MISPHNESQGLLAVLSKNKYDAAAPPCGDASRQPRDTGCATTAVTRMGGRWLSPPPSATARGVPPASLESTALAMGVGRRDGGSTG